MKRITRKFAAFMTAAVLVSSFAAPAAMAGVPGDGGGGKGTGCNAGRGNGSEGCDPGNSSTTPNGTTGQNMGGDEGGPISGGTGAT
jgi:hypothetical protein